MITQQPLPVEILRRCASEILACAILDLFPRTQLVTGGSTDTGFYYDCIFAHAFDTQALTLIEERVRTLIKENVPIATLDMMRENAATMLAHHKQPIRAELVLEADDSVVSIIKIGSFHNWCDAPHTTTTGQIGSIRLTGFHPVDGTDPVVMRIEGVQAENPMALKAYIRKLEEAKTRDHRLLGPELDLFSTSSDFGSGFWVWHPRGIILRDLLLEWGRQAYRKAGALTVSTPSFIKVDHLKDSGLLNVDELAQEVFPPISLHGIDFAPTPSRTIQHAFYYKARQHSYRELPIRYTEFAEGYSLDAPNQERGLLKARACIRDEATTFCTPEQAVAELISSLQFMNETSRIFGFESQLILSGRGKRSMGTAASWERATAWLREALKGCGLVAGEESRGFSFFGPGVYLRLTDAIGREWKGPHVVVDVSLPNKLALDYKGTDDVMHVPAMISRSTFGSLERFVALLLEREAGVLPLWLAPEQIRVLPLSASNRAYGQIIADTLQAASFRVGMDDRNEPLGTRVYDAERLRIPYIVIVGNQEEKKNCVTLRIGQDSNASQEVTVEALIKRLQEVKSRNGVN